MTAVPPPDPALRSALAFLCDYVKTLRHTEAVADCLHCNLNYVLRKTGEAVERTAVPPKKCEPVWGSCNLPSGHEGRHDAYAEWPAAVPPPDPIARLRDVVEHQPNFRGSRNDLLFLLDTITELQDDSDVESVRHALQTSEARVDRLTADLQRRTETALALKRSIDETWRRIPPHFIEPIETQQELWNAVQEMADRVDRLTAALRKYGKHTEACGDQEFGATCNCGLDAALAPADPEPPHE